MNVIKTIFQRGQSFVGFVVAGDGGVDYCVDCCLQLIEGGVDILELGFPFSDPIADGPVIQRASQRSLARGVNSDVILEVARRIRARVDIPLVLFSYYNPLLQLGSGYLHRLKSAGFNACLVVDLPAPKDAYEGSFFNNLLSVNLLPILLATPSTDEERLTHIGKNAQGFLYYVSQKGTTGIRNKLAEDFPAQISRLRKRVKLPIVAGFGIADRLSAAAVLDVADGFVVGSAFVKLMEDRVLPRELKLLAQTIDPR